MVIQADATLNGKILLEVVDDASMEITIYQMPRNFNNKKYWGLFPNGQVFSEVKSGSVFYIPSDWYFMVSYYIDYDRIYSSKTLKLRSWVAEYTADDVHNIKNAWKPTATEYVSPEEKLRREKEKQAKIDARLEEEKRRREEELAEAKRLAEERER